MKVLLSIPSLDLSLGGPSINVPMLACALKKAGVDVMVVSANGGNCHSSLLEYDIQLKLPATPRNHIIGYYRFLNSALENFSPDIVHDSGIWRPENHLICIVANKLARKFVVSPRGMLSPWALNYRRLKKCLAWHAYQKQDLKSADLLVATADEEGRDILRLLPTSRIAIVPNGYAPMRVHETDCINSESSRIRKALFFSRIHPKKGIELLLKAWRLLMPSDWELRIVGPGRDEYVNSLEKLAQEYMLEQSVKFQGPVYSDGAKAELFAESDVMVLPSYSENYGSVVVEALGSGIPVITTTGTPWSHLVDSGAGWWVTPTVESIFEALKEATSMSDCERERIGRAGRRLVADEYAWPKIADKTIEAYHNILTGSSCSMEYDN